MSKRVMWLFAGIIVLIGVIALVISVEKITVTAAHNTLTEQGWRAYFSAQVKEESIGTEDLYISDGKGKRLSVNITLNTDGKSLLVEELTPGTYTLHINKNAIKGKGIKRLKVNEVKFGVYETIEAVTSANELAAYFERAYDMQKRERSSFMAKEESSMDDSAPSSASDSTDYSTTNNQVEGVDEADSVKTDGKFIYSVSNNEKIVITDIRNPKKLSQIAKIKMTEEFYPSQLFLHNDTLVVLGEKYIDHTSVSSTISESKQMMQMDQLTTLRLYDISNRANPAFIREIGVEGYLNGARKTDEMLYLVTNVHPNYSFGKGIEETVIRPYAYDSAHEKSTGLIDYADISILPGATEPSYSVITAINLTSPADNKVVTKGYLGGSEQLYMSKKHLYLTTNLYDGSTESDGQEDSVALRQGNMHTALFKFGLNGTDVTFQSSAELKGSLLNQFSMDEHNGFFRVVLTEGNMWDDKNPSKNHLFILNENLKMTGSVEGLAKGERIYSARFMGDKAYMVTFRETDPLFVIDVENPTAPKVLGELKIPGFSNYLHPLDENHLIGFGYETVAKPNKDGGEPFIETLGMKISLFDVSDFANPKEKDTEIIGGRGTYSTIQSDHKALFTHKDKNLYGFPVVIYNESSESGHINFTSSGALIYEITPDKGIVLKGDLLEEKSEAQQYEEWEKEVQRLLYSEDTLYTVAMGEIKNYSLDSFSKVSEMLID